MPEEFASQQTEQITEDAFHSNAISPGGKQVWGTDSGGNKGWRSDGDVVYGTEPLRKQITVASQTWTWTHNLGYYPTVACLNDDLEVLQAHVQHIDTNSLQINHLYSLTGYIIAR